MQLHSLSNVPLIPFVLATILSVRGLQKRSLSPSGALLAFFTGFSMLALPLRTPGISLIAFYLVGSYATKTGKQRKAKLEAGHDEAGAGYRTALQVFCNSASALVATLLWGALFAPGFPAARWVEGFMGRGTRLVAYRSDRWCPLDESVNSGWSRMLLFVILGHFACCLGDTLASELGILSKTPPILITTLRTVPPGTNGGLSALGTSASIGGGVFMGLVMWATLVAENAACRPQAVSLLVLLLGYGALAGGLGSMIDSLLGATVQRTQVSEGRVLTDTATVPSDSSKVKTVSGLNLLDNNQVNLVSSIATALFLAYLA